MINAIMNASSRIAGWIMCLLLCLMLPCLDAHADPWESYSGHIHQEYNGPWKWTESNSKTVTNGDTTRITCDATITGYTGSNTDIEIPDKIIMNTSVEGDGISIHLEYEATVKVIGERAFYTYTNLTSVVIPNSVVSIGRIAFHGCSGLTSVTIPNSVTTIGDSAFSYCSSLSSVTIPNSVTSIESSTFSNCSGLTSVTIPDSVVSIGADAFDGCYSLTGVTIPSGVEAIYPGAFCNCRNLTRATVSQHVMESGLSIIFPLCYADTYGVWIGYSEALSFGNDSWCLPLPLQYLTLDSTVAAIYENAFEKTGNLTAIDVAAGNRYYMVSSADGCLYDIAQKTLLFCPRNKTSIVVPDGVTNIANYAFAYCSDLVSVKLPDSLKRIGDYAFLDCRKLSGLTIPSGVQTLSSTAFDNCENLWTEWYRTLADFAVNGRAYDLKQSAGDRAIATVTVSGDTAIDSFVLKDGKVYDSVLRIVNTSGSAARLTLPSGYTYETFRGAAPLTIPANSRNILTITRTADNVFLVTREELETVQ